MKIFRFLILASLISAQSFGDDNGNNKFKFSEVMDIPDLTLERIKYLDFRTEDLLVPTYLTAATLSQLWISRTCTRNFSWQSVRSNVEQSILTLMKTRFSVAASRLQCMWNANV